MNNLLSFLISLGASCIGFIIPLLIYAMTRKGGEKFDLKYFIITSRSRLFLGFITLVVVAAAITVIDGATQIFALVNLAPGGSALAVGFTLGGLFVSAVRGDSY